MEPDRWLGVEVRHLAALQAVASTGSFHGAAVELGYTQSAISQQIATLERAVGATLIERPGGPRPVSLTDAGRLLLRHAEAIVARLSAAKADLAALADGTAGTLRVGTYQSVAARILPTVLRRFRQAWPAIDIQLAESNDDRELLEAVECGDLDLTFSVLPLLDGPFEALEILRDPYVLLAIPGSRIATQPSPPTLREVAGERLIGTRHCRTVEHIEAYARTKGYALDISMRSDDNGTIHAMVGAGMGAAVMPMLSVDHNDPNVVVRELRTPLPPRIIALAWHRDRVRTRAAEAFVALAQEFCDDLATAA